MPQAKAKTPPHDVDSEISVLGAILLDKDALLKVADMLKPEHFYDAKHVHVFQAFLNLFLQGSAIDIVTVSRQLKKMKKLKASGGRAYLAQLLEKVPTAAHVEEYAQIVRDSAIRRGLITAAGSISELAFNDEQTTIDVLSSAQQELFNVSVSGLDRGFVHVRNLLEEAYEQAAKAGSDDEDVTGLPTGFVDLDKLLGGLQKSDLVILAARPSMGKTSLALNILKHTALHAKKKVAFFSLEMSKSQVMNRLLAMQAGVSLWDLNTGRLKDEEFTRLADAVGQLSEAEIWIDDQPGQNIMELKTKSRRLFLEQQVELVVVDYLQLIRGNSREGRVQEVSQISMELKNIARELNAPVLSLSQLSRKVEERTDRMPILSDLRDSGSIEQDADVVMFIHREEHYNQESPRKGIADIRVAKHRNGPTGDIELAWIGQYTSFGNLKRESAPPDEEAKAKKG